MQRGNAVRSFKYVQSTIKSADNSITKTTVLQTSVLYDYSSQNSTNNKTKFFLLGWDGTTWASVGDDFGVCKYFGSDTNSSDTYKCAKMITDQTGNNSLWWLRSGDYNGGNYAFYVDSSGRVSINRVYYSSVAVRPAFTLNI